MTTEKDNDEPRNTLTETGMERTKEERQKAGEKFNEAVSELKAAGDPTDFAQERVRTTPEHRSDDAADDDLYPEDTNDDAGNPGVEPGSEGQFDEDGDDDKPAKGGHPTEAEKDAAETRRAKETPGTATSKEHDTVTRTQWHRQAVSTGATSTTTPRSRKPRGPRKYAQPKVVAKPKMASSPPPAPVPPPVPSPPPTPSPPRAPSPPASGPDTPPSSQSTTSSPRYSARKKMRVDGKNLQPGDEVVGAGEWLRVESWVRAGYLEEMK